MKEMKKLIKIKPMFNRIVTTFDKYDEDQLINGVYDPNKVKGSVKEFQTVIAIGTTIKDIHVGDTVHINPIRYSVMKHEDKSLKNGVIGDNMVIGYQFPIITLNGNDCLLLYDQDVDFIVEESVELPNGSFIV